MVSDPFVPPPPPQEYRQLDLVTYATKVKVDVDRITDKSTVGRVGAAAPQLPGTRGGGAGMMIPPSSYQEVGLPVVETGLSENCGGGDEHNNGRSKNKGSSSSSSSTINGYASDENNGRGMSERNGFVGSQQKQVGGGASRGARGQASKVDELSKCWKGGPDDDIIEG